jgi:dihydropteroate synthase
MDTPIWQTTRFDLQLHRPLVMGIVNVTPDSFSDGGQHAAPGAALAHCERLLGEGVDILDLGAESTRPGAPRLAPDQEWARLESVLRAALSLGVPISVDTCKTEVMHRALDLGVDIINDVQALRDPGAEALLARHGSAGICLMHMRGEPASMQQQTDYADVVAEVAGFLRQRADALRAQGVAPARLVLDPGYGFAKTVEQNFELLRRQAELLALGHPLLVGWSRKSSLGAVTGRAVGERLPASLAAALAAVNAGAAVLRVHDVAATVDALKVWRLATSAGA